MEFNSLKDIIDHFGIKDGNKTQIKSALRKLIKEVHPDKNEDEFRTEKEKDRFMDLTAALEFLQAKNTNTDIAVKNEVSGLTVALNNYISTKNRESIVEVIEKKSFDLTSQLKTSVSIFHRQNLAPKLTSAGITIIVTALWTFPNVAKGHPLLSSLIRYQAEFTFVWLLILMLTSLLWVKVASNEKLDDVIKKNYKLESTQNAIFSLFINWMYAHHKGFSWNGEFGIITFSKDELVDFLIVRYGLIQHRTRHLSAKSPPELEMFIKDIPEDEYQHFNRKKLFSLNAIFPEPGVIDEEIAQTICDLIIERLNMKGALVKADRISLSDYYEFKYQRY